METLGIYIHIPFCKKKCPYCSFYSVESSENLQDIYINKVCEEISKWSKTLKKQVNTIYFGGGTPSLINTNNISKILGAINNNFKVIKPEITLEVNPADYRSIDFEKLKFLGVNRISLGVQSLDDSELKILGRRHNSEDVYSTYYQIRNAKIDNISFDFIIGTPNQTVESLDKFINFCSDNNIPHVSAYLLKVEEGTPYFYNRNSLNFLSDDRCSDFYMYFSERMKKLKYNHYEISNFALDGFESKHNSRYWNLSEYLGVGPSAHSFINGKRFFYNENIEEFILNPKILSEGDGGSEEEYVMLQLRLSKGLVNQNYRLRFKKDIPEEYFKKAEKYKKLGLLKYNENNISLTHKGFLLSNKIISDILF